MQAERISAKFKVWVVFGERAKMGDGRARLLELIDELGSIKKAVSGFGMSYRNAWGYLQELEKAAGFKILERTPGGGPRSGTRLTGAGRQFLKRYWRFRQGVDTAVRRHFTRAFNPNVAVGPQSTRLPAAPAAQAGRTQRKTR